MKVYRDKSLDLIGEPRSHPWTTSFVDDSCRYVDFRREPEKIATSLENFIPWQHYSATRKFYDFLRWVNGSESLLESNDCAFGLHTNHDPKRPFRLQADGRVMLFVTDLRLTCAPGFGEWLMSAFLFYLEKTQPESEAAIVGISQARSFFLATQQTGEQVVLYFWSWGDSEEAVFAALTDLFEHLLSVSKSVNLDIQETISNLERQRIEPRLV